MKSIVACYKCFRGGEWFETSLESIRSQCAGVVAVTSDLPWRGLPGTEGRDVGSYQENCRKPLSLFRKKYPSYPVTEIQIPGRPDSSEQYSEGLAAVKRNFGRGVGILVVDTDEVWEEEDLVRLRQAMTANPQALYFRSGVYTYLRSPFLRVHPQEKSRVVVGLAHPEVALGHSRFSDLARIAGRHTLCDVNCNYHHMGYVRLDPYEISNKLSNTSSQDGVPNRDNWKREVWDKLPAGKNIHPSIGYFSHWPGVTELGMSELPKSILQGDSFWAMSAHHPGSIPRGVLMGDDPVWREMAEADEVGVATTLSDSQTVSFLAAMGGRMSLGDCRFLVPRLRMSFRETCQLALHSSSISVGGKVVEVGSGMGGSVVVMGCHVLSGTEIVAIDPYLPYDEENLVLNQAVSVGTVEEFRQTVEHFGNADITLLQESSETVSGRFAEGTLDLVLVDGNHSYSHALFDLLTWWEKLKTGGTLLLHDLSGRFPGVVRAAREFEEKTGARFSLPVGSTLAWTRKP